MPIRRSGLKIVVYIAEESMNMRLEHDFLGTKEVPSDAYYGVQTLRAKENFPITGNGFILS